MLVAAHLAQRSQLPSTQRCFPPPQDHSRPSMPSIFSFLRDAATFMRASSKNVMAIHCKAGKGRTGTMCCIWLLYSKEALTAKEALELFAERRTDHIKSRKRRQKMIAVDTWSQVHSGQRLYTSSVEFFEISFDHDLIVLKPSFRCLGRNVYCAPCPSGPVHPRHRCLVEGP